MSSTPVTRSQAEFALGESARRLHSFLTGDDPVIYVTLIEVWMLKQRLEYFLTILTPEEQDLLEQGKAVLSHPNWPYDIEEEEWEEPALSPEEGWDPGPEVDDEGGMSEIRRDIAENAHWEEF